MDLSDEYIRRQFYLIGLGNRLGDRFVAELNRSNRDSRAILLELLPEIYARRPLSRSRAKMLEKLVSEIAAARADRVSRYRNHFEKELERLSRLEFARNNRVFSSLPMGGEPEEEPESLLPLLLGSALYDGASIDEWFQGFLAADYHRIRRGVSLTTTQERSSEQAVSDLLGTKSQQGRDGALGQAQNGARSLARTLVVGVATAARSLWTRSAEKTFGPMREVFTAVLDSRTTFLCASLHGSIYEVGEGPYPPLHPNCRSVRYPIPEALAFPDRLRTGLGGLAGKDFALDARRRIGGSRWERLGPTARARAVEEEKSRWLMRNVGSSPVDLTFETWFERQSAAFQREYLGATRYSAFKAGTLSVDQLVSPVGHRYTIDELRYRHIL